MPFPTSIRTVMKRAIWLLVIPMAAFGGIISCKSWKMDYGTPAAQFKQENLPEKGKPFIGKKITVKGKVVRVDTSSPKSAWVHPEGGIRCNFGDFETMASSYKVGDTIHVDGFLRQCEAGACLLRPSASARTWVATGFESDQRAQGNPPSAGQARQECLDVGEPFQRLSALRVKTRRARG